MTTDIAVTIFGREITVTADEMSAAETTLTLLTALDSLSERDRETLDEACRIVHDLRNSPAGEDA